MRVERNILISETPPAEWSRYESTYTNPPSCGAPRINYRYPGARLVSVDYFARDDVHMNRPDSYGFRAPSAYWSEEKVEVAPSGTTTIFHRVTGSDVRYLCPGKYYFWSDKYNVVQHLPSVQFPDQTSIAPFNLRTVNSLKLQALAGMKDQRINLGMTLAFMGKTISTMDRTLYNLMETHRDIKARRWHRIAKRFRISAKSSSSFYLEFLFHWKQLFRDLVGAAQELERSGSPAFSYVYGRARHKVSMPVSSTIHPYEWGRVAGHTFTGVRSCEQKVVMIARVEHSVLSRMSVLGLTNPAELLWDLIPWSWVINTTLSIGQYLSSLDATAGMTYLGGSYTLYRQTTGLVEVTALHHVDAANRFHNGKFSHRRSDRTPIDDSTHIEIKNPFSGPLAITAAVLAALVVKFRDEKKVYDTIPRDSVKNTLRRKRRPRYLAPIPYKVS